MKVSKNFTFVSFLSICLLANSETLLADEKIIEMEDKDAKVESGSSDHIDRRFLIIRRHEEELITVEKRAGFATVEAFDGDKKRKRFAEPSTEIRILGNIAPDWQAQIRAKYGAEIENAGSRDNQNFSLEKFIEEASITKANFGGIKGLDLSAGKMSTAYTDNPSRLPINDLHPFAQLYENEGVLAVKASKYFGDDKNNAQLDLAVHEASRDDFRFEGIGVSAKASATFAKSDDEKMTVYISGQFMDNNRPGTESQYTIGHIFKLGKFRYYGEATYFDNDDFGKRKLGGLVGASYELGPGEAALEISGTDEARLGFHRGIHEKVAVGYALDITNKIQLGVQGYCDRNTTLDDRTHCGVNAGIKIESWGKKQKRKSTLTRAHLLPDPIVVDLK